MTRFDFEIPEGTPESTCKSCGAPIAWVTVGERADGSPSIKPLHLRSAQVGLDGVRRAESHFAHCPDADRWRKGRRR